MGICVQCGKKTDILDKHGCCEKCHDENFIRRMKKLAGDETAETGIKYIRQGLLNKPACRLCGTVFGFSEIAKIDKRTGYCLKCIDELKKREQEARIAAYRETHREERIRLRGTTFYPETFQRIGFENEDYYTSKKQLIEEEREGERVYELEFDYTAAKIVPEPDNPNDPNALAVNVDGDIIGYVPKEKQRLVNNILNLRHVEAVMVDPAGGKYRVLTENEDGYSVLTDEAPFWADLIIKYED